MKKLLFLCLILFAASALAQQSLLGTAASTGASAGTAAVARLSVTTPLAVAVTPTIQFDATQHSTAHTNTPAVIVPALVPFSPFTVSGVGGTSDATSTGNATGTASLPAGVLGNGGSAAIGQGYAASGNFGARTNAGTLPPLPTLLPTLPNLTIVIPVL